MVPESIAIKWLKLWQAGSWDGREPYYQHVNVHQTQTYTGTQTLTYTQQTYTQTETEGRREREGNAVRFSTNSLRIVSFFHLTS